MTNGIRPPLVITSSARKNRYQDGKLTHQIKSIDMCYGSDRSCEHEAHTYFINRIADEMPATLDEVFTQPILQGFPTIAKYGANNYSTEQETLYFLSNQTTPNMGNITREDSSVNIPNRAVFFIDDTPSDQMELFEDYLDLEYGYDSNGNIQRTNDPSIANIERGLKAIRDSFVEKGVTEGGEVLLDITCHSNSTQYGKYTFFDKDGNHISAEKLTELVDKYLGNHNITYFNGGCYGETLFDFI
jgi:hypothetical protein